MLTPIFFLIALQLLLASGGPLKPVQLYRRNVNVPPRLEPAHTFNPNNASCAAISPSAVPPLSTSAQWQKVNGDSLMVSLTKFFDENLLVCKPCFGQTKSACTSQDPSCQEGLNDQALVRGVARYDVAAAIFVGLRNRHPDFQCSIPVRGCNDAFTCEDCDSGPGGFSLMRSLQDLSKTWQKLYDQIETTSQAVSPKTISSFANNFAAKWQDQVPPQVFSSWLESTTRSIQKPLVDMSNDLFTFGQWQDNLNDGATNISISDFAQSGQLLAYKQVVVSAHNITLVLLQQLALAAWDFVAQDNLQHIPFITFDTVRCDNVNPKLAGSLAMNPLFKDFDMSNGVDLDGYCYYLLDAAPGGPDSNICNGSSPLAGATKAALAQYSQEFSGLSLENWVVPAVTEYRQNNNSDAYTSLLQLGSVETDSQQAAAVWIPICDFAHNSPATSCPKLGEKVTVTNEHKACATY